MIFNMRLEHLLMVNGMLFAAGYGLHIVGYDNWATLIIAGVSVLIAGKYWEKTTTANGPQVTILTAGTVLAAIAILTQISVGDFSAVLLSAVILAIEISIAILIWQRWLTGLIDGAFQH